MQAWETLPKLSPLLRDRKLAFVIFGFAAVALALLASGVVGWPCPFLLLTGIPCPGCGLTRATLLLLRGRVTDSLHFHAFSPVVLLGLLILASAVVLPEGTRMRWVDTLTWLEKRTGVVLILLGALIVYWLARLIFFHSAYVQLIGG
jgi:hypothetical protein